MRFRPGERDDGAMPGRDEDAQQELAARLSALPVTAPAHLQAHVAHLVADANSGRNRRARRPAAALGALTLAATAIVLFVVVGSPPAAPAVPALARFALTAATGPAPAVDPAYPEQLRAHMGDVAFPRWGAAVGWTATGGRSGRLDGRPVVAVAYRSPGGGELGYAVLARPAVAAGAGTARTVRGVRFVVGRSGATTTVTWRRDGHTCVLAARGVSADTLVALAVTQY